MANDVTEALRSAPPQVGSFVNVRGKTWIVEGAEQRGQVQALRLISCEDDSQGEAIELAYAAELQPEIIDPNDWSPLLTRTFEGPQRLGAYLRSTEWRTATAADRKLFQAPFRAGIRLEKRFHRVVAGPLRILAEAGPDQNRGAADRSVMP